jgi:DNA-binding Lrp family transcriptional regulator
MDAVETKILVELVQNSRSSYSALAKKCKISREVATLKVKKLVEAGIIHDFYTEIDFKKLGFISALLFVRIKTSYEKELIEYIKKSGSISWAGTHCGKWSLGMAIYGVDTEDIEKKFQEIYSMFKDGITDHQFEFYKNSEFFYEKYLDIKPIVPKNKYTTHKIDSKDKLLLSILSKNSRITCVEISIKLEMSAVAVAKRIKNLEDSGFIRKYSIFMNLPKIKKYLFAFFITNQNIDQRKELYAHLKAHSKVPFVIDYVGDPFLEFGVFVDDPYEVRDIAQKIEESFQSNRIVDFFLVQEEFVSTGLPPCVFE